MLKQGCQKTIQVLGMFAVAALLSGCQTVGTGPNHPFATMFQNYDPTQYLDREAQAIPVPAFEPQSADIGSSSIETAQGDCGVAERHVF